MFKHRDTFRYTLYIVPPSLSDPSLEGYPLYLFLAFCSASPAEKYCRAIAALLLLLIGVWSGRKINSVFCLGVLCIVRLYFSFNSQNCPQKTDKDEEAEAQREVIWPGHKLVLDMAGI